VYWYASGRWGTNWDLLPWPYSQVGNGTVYVQFDDEGSQTQIGNWNSSTGYYEGSRIRTATTAGALVIGTSWIEDLSQWPHPAWVAGGGTYLSGPLAAYPNWNQADIAIDIEP